MEDYKDFTVDQTNFGDLGQWLSELKANNSIKFVPVIDVGIAQRLDTIDNYTTYTDGVNNDVFIKSGADNFYNYQIRQFTGFSWPGDIAFVDFTSQNTSVFW